jgi:hypothetical protein
MSLVNDSLGIAVIKTFCTRMSRTRRINTDFLKEKSVQLRDIVPEG